MMKNEGMTPFEKYGRRLDVRLESIERRLDALESPAREGMAGAKAGAERQRIPHQGEWRPLRVPEAAELLGRTRSAIYQLVEKRRIPFHKSPTGNLYFDRAELLEWAGVLNKEGGEPWNRQQ